jgi:hypothetical protein
MKTFTARNLALGLTLGAAAIAGTAYAEQAMRGDGVTTRAEVQTRSAAMFARMDANKDGKLDQADREARRNMMFDRLDTDKSGQISRAEFSARPQRPEGMGEHGPDGGKAHAWGGHGRGGWRHHGGGMMMGRMADADKDGAITQAEFTGAALQRFDRTDANKDGQVTKEERQAARKAMRDEWRARREAAAPTAPAE